MTSRNTLTIAMVIATPGTEWGGMEKHTVELADALACRGHSIHFIGHPGYESRVSARVRFHGLPVGLSRHNPILWWKLRDTLRKIEPDICHGHGNKAIELLSRVKLETKKAGTIHGIKKRHTGLSDMDAAICINKTTLATINHPDKTLIYHGSAHEPAAPMACRSSPFGKGNSVRAVAIGRLEAVKGFDGLISAWAELTNDAQLFILGEGSQRSMLENQIADSGLSSRVFLPGFQQDIASWLCHADVCVISSHREGLSYVLIEALQAGCPVLSTPIAGAIELLPATAVAQSSSPEALFQLLDKHLTALENLREEEQPAVAYARTELTIESMTSRTEKLYFRLTTKEMRQ